jgi:uncharacterized membrane protein SpoIIM required for sporulation
MIVNLDRFIAGETPLWKRLDEILRRLEEDAGRTLTLDEARELDRLYRRASADLARITTFSAEPETRRYLERLVARGFAEIHSSRAASAHFRLGKWLTNTFPQTFRKHGNAFLFAVALTLAGVLFGGLAIALDPEAREVLMPFPELMQRPSERVRHEEEAKVDRYEGKKASFSGFLMTHNTQVTLTAMACGMTWGIGTILIVFTNGVMLGAVAVDYILDGQTTFLLGWLLPHGVAEIPAILIGSQAGFVLAHALLARRSARGLADRLRRAVPDVVTLFFGAALLLVWAGLVEGFFSQYHEPVIPYGVKIALGVVEAVALTAYLARSGRGAGPSTEKNA